MSSSPPITSSSQRHSSSVPPLSRKDSLVLPDIPDSDYDKEFFQRVVADAGRWAYGVVFVEVWVMNEHRTLLERPEGGFWVDPVARDYGENNSKFQRLIDPTLEDYFPPTPQAPGVGIPGTLWAQATRGNIAVESSSIRNGTIFGGGGGRSRRGHRRNRTLFPFETVRDGTNFGGSGVAANFHADLGSDENAHQRDSDIVSRLVEDGNTKPTTIIQKHHLHHRRSATMDDVATMAAANKSGSLSQKYRTHRRFASGGQNSDIEIGGRWKHSWRRSFRKQDDRHEEGGGFPRQHYGNNLLPNDVRWRRIAELAADPDQPFNPRISYLEYDCDLGYAAGVPFQIGQMEGIVVYMARKSAKEQKLLATTNEEYLTHSALLIGSAFALRGPRMAVERERRLESHETMQRVKAKMKALTALNQNVQSFVAEESMRKEHETSESRIHHTAGNGCCSIYHRVVNHLEIKATSCYRKFFGVQAAPTPPFTWEQTGITFFGTCVTLSVLMVIDFSLVEAHGRDFGIVLGPFGALMTLLFSLTSAPASQPQNIVLGQLLSLFVAYGFGRIPINHRIKACLSTSVSISVMARLGITHPPAGASALIFSSGSHSLAQVGMMLMANVIAVVLGAWCNNISDKRQYPTSWQIAPCFSWFSNLRFQPNPPVCNSSSSYKENANHPDYIGKRDEDRFVSSKTIRRDITNNGVTVAFKARESTRHSSTDAKVDRHSLLFGPLSSIFQGEVSNASLQQPTAPSVLDSSLIDKRSEDAGDTIELTAVLAQARNPAFREDSHSSVPTGVSILRNSHHKDDYSHLLNGNHENGTINLSEVIAAANAETRRPMFIPDGETTNQSFIRLRDKSQRRSDGEKLTDNEHGPKSGQGHMDRTKTRATMIHSMDDESDDDSVVIGA